MLSHVLGHMTELVDREIAQEVLHDAGELVAAIGEAELLKCRAQDLALQNVIGVIDQLLGQVPTSQCP